MLSLARRPMEKKIVKIGEINFELTVHDVPDLEPTLEIENDASMIYETLSVEKALALRELLDRFIGESQNFNENLNDAIL
jgi:hypothetical protein